MTINGGSQVTTAERAEMLNYGTNECFYCGQEFTVKNPCWNDEATYENGTHKYGECKQCAQKVPCIRVTDGKSAGEDTMYWTSSSGRIELRMTLEQARSVSHQGQCDADVQELMRVPAIAQQLVKIDPAILSAELKEWGAWDETERADHGANQARLVWLAGCDIAEEHRAK